MEVFRDVVRIFEFEPNPGAQINFLEGFAGDDLRNSALRQNTLQYLLNRVNVPDCNDEERQRVSRLWINLGKSKMGM